MVTLQDRPVDNETPKTRAIPPGHAISALARVGRNMTSVGMAKTEVREGATKAVPVAEVVVRLKEGAAVRSA
jgi:hypothetical protein